jgi:hypothetical protein
VRSDATVIPSFQDSTWDLNHLLMDFYFGTQDLKIGVDLGVFS